MVTSRTSELAVSRNMVACNEYINGKTVMKTLKEKINVFRDTHYILGLYHRVCRTCVQYENSVSNHIDSVGMPQVL